ncbi:phage tail tape measure protein [Pectobacterium odoriferum]|uniref:phage tail tape measure protein n=1 Tax=Pectobacterium odoriferum TaxID=78398 RepID=UPI0004FFDDA3|nr:phage tail tape measure protein [Pectobacterium odoriferum]KGA37141.1 tail protein [Pectobacterium odoriferum]GKX44584.1 phage tail tape measure protein [Pectobacterium carotovorum subsp. carotovorum]GLX58438.1 phage tail tape measure protein [Pectobacterium carotovorum subsp. carotovorum]
MSNTLQLSVLLKAVDNATRPFKAVQTASKKLSGDIRNSQTQLKELNAQAGRIEGFRKASGQLAVTGNALKKAKADAAALVIELKNTERPTRAQTQAMESAKRSAAELHTKYNGLRQSVQRQRTELQQAGISTRKLSGAERQLRTDISQTTSTLDRQRAALSRVSQQQEKLNTVSKRYEKGKAITAGVRNASAAAFGVGSAALYAESRLIAPGIEFDKQMSGTQSILGLDKENEKLKAIRQQAREIGATTAFSPNDVARTQTTLARSGYNADAVLAATGSTVNLSLASGMDIAESADIVTNMQSAFNIPIDQIQRVADVMTTGFTSSNTSLYELGEAMKYVAPIAEAAGASIEDTTAMLGTLADNGIKGSMAGTSTSAVFNRLQAPVGQAVDALKELGVKTRDKKGNALPIYGVLKAIDASFKKNKLGSAQQAEYLKVIFGEEAMKSAIKLVDAAGNGKLDEKRKAIGESSGSTGRVAKIQTDNLDGDLKNLVSAWEDIQIEVFEKQDGALRKLTQSATEWLTTTGNWVKANPELVGQIAKTIGVVTTLVAALGGIGLVAWPVMSGINALVGGAGLLSAGFRMAGSVITTAITALSLPILGVVAIFAGAIAAIVVGALLIRKYWEPIGAFFGGVLEGLKIAFAPIAELFAPLKPVFDWLGEKLKAAWEWFKQLVAPVKSTQETLDSCRNAGVAFGEMLANALTMPVQALNQLRGGIDWVLEKLGVIDKKSDGLGDKVPKEALTPEGTAALNAGVSRAPTPQGNDAKAIAARYSGAYDNGGRIPLGEFAVVGEHGPEIVEGPVNVTSRKKTAAMASAAMNMSAYRPIAPTVQASAASSPVSIHAPISIVAQPGQNAQDIAQEVTRQLEQRERAARSRAFSQYSYQGG